MNTMQIFKYEDNEVRTLEQMGEVWWVLADVCRVLDIKNSTDVRKRLDEDERARFNLGRQGEANIINESGLYKVILRSDKPEAKKFTRWVTHEVLPTIRKTGGYGQGTRQGFSLEQMVRFATEVATQVVAQIVPVIATVVKEAIQESRLAAPTIGEAMDTMDFYSHNRCKLETFPTEITEQVDGMLEDMIRQQALNFSHIARYCTLQGHPISSPAVKRYFDRRVEEGI